VILGQSALSEIQTDIPDFRGFAENSRLGKNWSGSIAKANGKQMRILNVAAQESFAIGGLLPGTVLVLL